MSLAADETNYSNRRRSRAMSGLTHINRLHQSILIWTLLSLCRMFPSWPRHSLARQIFCVLVGDKSMALVERMG